MQKVSVTITPDLRYYVNDRRVVKSRLEFELSKELEGKEGVVVLHIDKSVPTEYLVEIAGIATSMGAKVSIATQPNNY